MIQAAPARDAGRQNSARNDAGPRRFKRTFTKEVRTRQEEWERTGRKMTLSFDSAISLLVALSMLLTPCRYRPRPSRRRKIPPFRVTGKTFYDSGEAFNRKCHRLSTSKKRQGRLAYSTACQGVMTSFCSSLGTYQRMKLWPMPSGATSTPRKRAWMMGSASGT